MINIKFYLLPIYHFFVPSKKNGDLGPGKLKNPRTRKNIKKIECQTAPHCPAVSAPKKIING